MGDSALALKPGQDIVEKEGLCPLEDTREDTRETQQLGGPSCLGADLFGFLRLMGDVVGYLPPGVLSCCSERVSSIPFPRGRKNHPLQLRLHGMPKCIPSCGTA